VVEVINFRVNSVTLYHLSSRLGPSKLSCVRLPEIVVSLLCVHAHKGQNEGVSTNV
jgi:hypothetical protein